MFVVIIFAVYLTLARHNNTFNMHGVCFMGYIRLVHWLINCCYLLTTVTVTNQALIFEYVVYVFKVPNMVCWQMCNFLGHPVHCDSVVYISHSVWWNNLTMTCMYCIVLTYFTGWWLPMQCVDWRPWRCWRWWWNCCIVYPAEQCLLHGWLFSTGCLYSLFVHLIFSYLVNLEKIVTVLHTVN